MRTALSSSKPSNNRPHLIFPLVAPTPEIKGDDDENGDTPRHQANDICKSTNAEPLNKTQNPVSRKMTSTSRDSINNLLLQTHPSLPTALVSLPAASGTSLNRPQEKVFPHKSHLNSFIDVGDLPPSRSCTPPIWHPNRISPNSFQLLISGFACQLLEGRSMPKKT